MFNMIHVHCPHCGTHGQMVAPPLGSLILGPCPNCQEFVLIFCGKVLALDSQIIRNGSQDERRAHLMEVTMGFVDEYLGTIVDQIEKLPPSVLNEYTGESSPSFDCADYGVEDDLGRSQSKGIGEEEVARFLEKELPRIDNQEYFKEVFAPRP